MELKSEMEKFLEERRNANSRSINRYLDGSHIISQLRIEHQKKVSQRAETRYLGFYWIECFSIEKKREKRI